MDKNVTMADLSRYFRIPLSRSPRYTAIVRRKDFAILFVPTMQMSGEEENYDQLFTYSEHLIQERQPRSIDNSKRKTLTVYLVLSERCNLRCIYCDVLGKYREKCSQMTWDCAKASIDILVNRLKTDPQLYAQMVFFGGEPILNWPILVRACEYLTSLGLDSRIEMMLITNGTLINRKKALFLKDHKVYVVVSLDGRETVNDIVRRYPNDCGSFCAALEGIEHLMEAIPNGFGVSCTLGSHNVSTLSDEIVFLHDQFRPSSIGINIYHYQQDGTSPVEIDDETLCRSLLDVFQVARVRGIVIHQFLGILNAFINHRLNRNYCAACSNKLLFTSRGRVGRCEALMFDDQFTVPLIDVKKNSIALPSKLDWSMFTPEHERACIDCVARWICPGGCVYDNLARTAILCGTEPRRCKFFVSLINEMLSLVLDAALVNDEAREVLIPSQHHIGSVRGKIPVDALPTINQEIRQLELPGY